MKIIRLTLAVLFLAISSAAAAYAQAPAAASQVPASKVAVVNSDVFYDAKDGIARLSKAIESVQKEFDPKRTELRNLEAEITRKAEEYQRLGATLGQPGSTATEADLRNRKAAIDQMQKDYKRKGEDAQAELPRRISEVQRPIIDDILKALDAYAKAHGITLTLDSAKMPDAIMTLMPSVDITSDFVKDYNSRNPATASVARP